MIPRKKHDHKIDENKNIHENATVINHLDADHGVRTNRIQENKVNAMAGDVLAFCVTS